jgi:hypothetical protein
MLKSDDLYPSVASRFLDCLRKVVYIVSRSDHLPKLPKATTVSPINFSSSAENVPYIGRRDCSKAWSTIVELSCFSGHNQFIR